MTPFDDEYVVSHFCATVQRNESAVLHEGLPHQHFERELLATEIQTKPLAWLHKFPFYQLPLPFLGQDWQRLAEILGEPATYFPYRGAKFCGGFHPDYAVELLRGSEFWQALICFGCEEIKLYGPDCWSHHDLDVTGIHFLLKSYRRRRPQAAQP